MSSQMSLGGGGRGIFDYREERQCDDRKGRLESYTLETEEGATSQEIQMAMRSLKRQNKQTQKNPQDSSPSEPSEQLRS